MNNLTIAKRIALGFAAMILIVAVLGLVAITRLSATNREANRITDQCMPGLCAISQILDVSSSNFSDLLTHLGTTNLEEKAKLLKRIQSRREANDSYFSTYQATITQTADRATYEQLAVARTNMLQARTEVLKLSGQLQTAEALESLRTKLQPALLKYRELIETEVNLKKTESEQASRRIRTAERTGRVIVWAGLGLAVIVGGGMGGWIIRDCNRRLRNISSTMAQGAAQVASAASQISASSQTLAEGASEQAAALEESSASLEEMSSTTQANAEEARQANQLAKQARGAAEACAINVQAMNGGMAAIKASSNDIARIVKTIDEIAFQTNILALNAAVEAARAGESGLGFAVVADEVRNLAQRSTQAARETAAKIQGAITNTERGVQITVKVAQGLQEIRSKVLQVDDLVTQVATASHEQSQGIAQVTTAVGQVDLVTQSTAAAAEQSASASAVLNAQAETLRLTVQDLLVLVDGTHANSSSRNDPHPLSVSPSTMAEQGRPIPSRRRMRLSHNFEPLGH